ncbi:sugar ABC transporter ATP-binding protein [Saliterribacillus persicus]|uniref:Monosaccharide ABC transporter ATP-binding protein (CUT2 family) n=1 Tax=Saliterribacillus persicus TaxID=930114 RepID=A0A368XPL5_9BACI|nr:sugar ABC transporter ATP-binding protein [Saliterribacillus persicus]RCW69805.1 monosaccharide ABC transporter ATP-binding protein (CUT2 family) [Saliterribacillus persicus]
MTEHILELNGITKEFPGVKALDNVQFELKTGEIHALMGENGAGKSTFIKVITGVHQPNEGRIKLEGEEITFQGPKDANAKGIAAIYQHVTNYPDLSITENIYMGHEKINKKTRMINWKEMHQDAKKLLESLGSKLDPKTEMSVLSVAQQQIVEIAKALSSNAKIIIMDEPTAALTHRESEELYKITERLRDEGVSIIFISHRFEDMYRLADRVTVFRDSQYIGTWNVVDITNDDLIVAMVGREIKQLFPDKTNIIKEEVLRLEKLGQIGRFKDISINLHRGEILGITGLVGAGRSELCQAMFGIEPYDEGAMYFEGTRISIDNPTDAIKLGIGYLPEDRQAQSLILQWEIKQNITLASLAQYSKNGWLNEKKEREIAKELAEKVDVKTNSVFSLASSLSGGNQQKVSVAKLLTTDLKVIIFDEPTKGVDIGAKSAIYQIIVDLASSGYGIIMVSSEMPEVLGLSDRIAVMCEGRLTKVMGNEEATQEKILEAAMTKEMAVH